MSSHERFHIRSLDELRREISRLGLRIPLEADLSVLASPVRIAGRFAPNRFAAQPMEGFDADDAGAPGPLAFRRYLRYARGGFGLIWIEATAVVPEARSNPRQFWLHRGSAEAFRRLVQDMRRAAREAHGHDIVVIVQLTHSGRYSKPDGVPRPIIAHHSAVLDPQHRLPPDYPLIGDDALDALQGAFVEAARLARDAGADGVDVKSCHRYLVSELLASFTREGRYGGSFENRSRFLLETLRRISAEASGLFVTTRMNAYDAIAQPYGFGVCPGAAPAPDLSEPLELVRRLCALGAPVLNVSVGNPYFNPHVGRPYDFPTQGMSAPDEHPLAGIARFMEITRRAQEAAGAVPVIGGGYSWLRQWLPNVAAGAVRAGWASLAGLGREAFAYPDAPADVIRGAGMDPDKCCVACSACTQIMRDGGMTGCVVRDPAVYGPQYREARRLAADRLRAEARRCRDCERPTCARGCPAGVNVPAFVKAFAEDDVARAYAILRERNALPEACARLCPSEVQCEGCCVETIFCQNPVPVRDIQQVVCRLARERGLAGVRLPPPAGGRSVGVVGAGPAGLACAIRLLELGRAADVYDREAEWGGTPDALIPATRYGRSGAEISAILKPALDAGRIVIRPRTELGRDVSLDDLRARHDAILLAAGLGGSGEGARPPGAYDAVTFLREAKRGRLAGLPGPVAVVGGGNTAVDAALAARQLGAADVYLVYRRSFEQMPAWPAERAKLLEQGVHVLILTQPAGYALDAAGALSGLRVCRTSLGDADATGRRRPAAVPGTEHTLPVRTVVEATGQVVPAALRAALAGVAFTAEGLVRTAGPDSAATSLEGVFAAGDLVNGGATVVQGVAEGMRAAAEIDAWLRRRQTNPGGG